MNLNYLILKLMKYQMFKYNFKRNKFIVLQIDRQLLSIKISKLMKNINAKLVLKFNYLIFIQNL